MLVTHQLWSFFTRTKELIIYLYGHVYEGFIAELAIFVTKSLSHIV